MSQEIKGSVEFKATKSDKHLSVVLFYRDEGCKCVRQRKFLDEAARYFTNAEFGVRFYIVHMDEMENLEIMDECCAFEPPHMTYMYDGNQWEETTGLRSVTMIINKVFDIVTKIKERHGVTL